MEDFRIIYRILKYLQQSMDFEEFDCAGFTAARFGESEPLSGSPDSASEGWVH